MLFSLYIINILLFILLLKYVIKINLKKNNYNQLLLFNFFFKKKIFFITIINIKQIYL